MAFSGFCASYSGKWMAGYAGDYRGIRNYQDESINSVLKTVKYIQGVTFIHSSYLDLEIPPNSIIYCDPPYRGTTGYKDKFDHEIFWQWCRHKSDEGHTVYISEYSAPEDFICVWQKELKSSLSANGKTGGSKTSTEKLYTYL